MRRLNPDDLPLPVLETSYKLGRLVAAARKSNKLSQKQLCERAGLGRTTLVEIEHGSPRVQFAYWALALDALGLLANLDALLSASDMDRLAKSVSLSRT